MNVPYYRLRHIYDNLSYPELQLRACLSGPYEDRIGFNQWLGRAGCKIVEDPLEADFVIFTGGADVSPSLYNEIELAETFSDPDRDAEDILLYKLCQEHGIPMVGICRGSQFLWVMKGGKLFQDVNNHNSGSHEILVFKEQKKYRSSSVHHQMVYPNALNGMKLLANCTTSSIRKTPAYVSTSSNSDFEIWAFEKDAILGIQGHPEYPGYPHYSELCLRLIEEHIYDNPNTIYRGGKLRLSQPLLPDNIVKLPFNPSNDIGAA